MTPKERAAMQQALEALLRSIPDELLMISGPEEADAFHREAITALREALAEQAEQEPVAWMSPNKERLEFSRKDTVYGSHTIPLYAAPVRTKDLTDGLCGGCAKKAADGWALYCVECWEKAEQRSDSERMEPVAERFEKMHANGDVWITTLAAAAIARNATPVRTKDLTDDEIVHLVNSVWFLDELMVAKVNFARAVIAADREKNK